MAAEQGATPHRFTVPPSCRGRGAAPLERCAAEPGPTQAPKTIMGPGSAAHHFGAALHPGHASAFSRRDSPELVETNPQAEEGAGKAGCPCAPAASHANGKSIRVSPPQVRRFTPAFPARWFYGFL